MATESVLEPPRPAIVDDFGVDQQRTGSTAGNPIAAASMSSMRRTVRPSKPKPSAIDARSVSGKRPAASVRMSRRNSGYERETEAQQDRTDRCADRVRSGCEFGCIAFVGPVVWMSFQV
jgi:hypothetical protein